MSDIRQNDKRIIKNTAALYVRMLLVMVVSLYISRITLAALGAEDFGIYNVVGGVITLISILNASFSGATSRFLTFELGKDDLSNVSKVFHCSMSIHFIVAFIILILAETIGLWFVCNKLVIPVERQDAAFWTYQCSVLTILIMIISTPYNALIIASEKMNVFAIISIVETLAKLSVALIIARSSFDRLIYYAGLLLLVQIFIRVIYAVYCRYIYKYIRTDAYFMWDSCRIKEMSVYAGWMMNGGFAYMGYTQGINILLNLFFGPIVNASRAIAVQVQAAVNNFATSIQTAVRPQITKYYAQQDRKSMHRLVIFSSKYSFYLMMLIALPLLVNTQFVLTIWLKEVPQHAVVFVQLTLLTCLNYALSGPTMMAIHATGDIRKFQLVESGLLLSVVPIGYLMLRFAGISPAQVLIIYLCIETLAQFVRVWIVYPRVGMKIFSYFSDILLPIGKVVMCLSPFLYFFYRKIESSLGNFLISSISLGIMTIVAVYAVGLQSDEKLWLKSKIKSCYDRIFSKIIA